eukprot:TRINITY_DN10806_c0_g1_i1.p1 TRINITY_DN10806_c0_g1~~TRINITY_DN10806_c0_g1_i1.p1  ORF type:complete len:115 (-),score=18.21 TRINITY_DN10806_c0_g1_i1:12-356(-)
MLIGDVNIFFNDSDDPTGTGELEVMIAESSYRGKGMGKEAVQLMMAYSLSTLKVRKYVVRISVKNVSSIQMFGGLGFQQVGDVNYFGEICMELVPDANYRSTLEGIHYEIKDCH